MILISNHNFSTPNKPSLDVAFPLFNEGQLVEHSFDVEFNYNFNSTPFNQFMITAQNQITMLSGSFAETGIVAGDSIDIDAIVTGGSNINVTATVLSVSGNVLTLTANVFSSGQVNEIFPQVNNQEMFIVNNTRKLPETIDLFYNLSLNGTDGTNASLWDGEVNRFTATVPTSTGTALFTQLGNKSGGTFVNAEIELFDGVYTVRFQFIPWLSEQTNNLNQPSWYLGANAVKPRVDIYGYSVAGNPNNYVRGLQTAWLGVTGWFDEAYNQGADVFTISELLIENEDAEPITQLNANQTSTVSFRVAASSGAVSDDVQICIYSLLPFSASKNNALKRIDNQIGFHFSSDGTVQGVKSGASLEIDNVVVTTDTDDILVEFDVIPNSTFPTYIQSLGEIEYRLAINVQGDISFKNTTKTINHGIWQFPTPPPTELDDKDAGFLNHAQEVGDPILEVYAGTTEDDMLFHQLVVLEKFKTYDNIRVAIEVIRDSDSALVATLQQILFPFSGVPIVAGKYQLNITQAQNQYLDSEDRNAHRLFLEGGETSEFYNVTMILSLMANWRDWVAQANILPDFYDFTLPQNGQSAEWVNYLRLSGYSLRFRWELNGENQTFYNRAIELLDYDESENVTSEIVILNSAGDVVPNMVSNQTYTIRAIHTRDVSSTVWNVNTWGWIGCRPVEGEPTKRISTAYPWTVQNLPLQPLDGEDRALLTFVSSTVIWIECKVNSNDLPNNTTFVTRIQDLT